MILNTAPQNEAILSNVGQIGEFRIRNSAKAFSILSSGLYANKIRAIIRELSCNAVDSHTAAGKTSTPFDVHLPNSLDPTFRIRDYGTGLTHEQVTNIYTTYFESTKTASNEFIGALGLGSKSPFSYTDNFTVVAVKDGMKGVYTAFINNEGVPSIALMSQEECDEPSGVEIKFAVNDRWDFDKFRQEARNVYKYFALRPVVDGTDFRFEDPVYESKDIVPGIHAYANTRNSFAIMGNIAYPIDVPNAETVLGDLRGLLGCGLEIHFAIGELDFQASREGLSYVPQTIESIKQKLTALNAQLSVHLAEEADAIKNLWDRAVFLYKKKDHSLWTAAVKKYATDTALPTYVADGYQRPQTFILPTEELARKYNVQLRAVQRSRGQKTFSNLKDSLEYSDKLDKDGHRITFRAWHMTVDSYSHFVVSDLKVGATERVKYHYRETDTDSRTIWIMEPVDRTKPMNAKAFFKRVHNPPVDRQFAASSLTKKERVGLARNVTIMCLERRGGRSGYSREQDMVWRDAGKADSFDANQTYYYVPLSGFNMLSTKGYGSGKELYDDVTALSGLFSGEIYGVRKGDIEAIRSRKNWVNFEEHVAAVLNGKDISKIVMGMVKSQVDTGSIYEYNNSMILGMIDSASPYKLFVKELADVEKFKGNTYNVRRLFQRFAPNANFSPDALVEKYQNQANEVLNRYPLLKAVSGYRSDSSAIAQYINLIDSANKGE
jgi:hypothetical protein